MVSSYDVAMLVFGDEDTISKETTHRIKEICKLIDPILNSKKEIGVELGIELVNDLVHLKLTGTWEKEITVVFDSEELDKIAKNCSSVSFRGLEKPGFIIDITI